MTFLIILIIYLFIGVICWNHEKSKPIYDQGLMAMQNRVIPFVFIWPAWVFQKLREPRRDMKYFNKPIQPPEELMRFQGSFSKEQKAVIMVSLILVSSASGFVHPKEEEDVAKTAILLGLNLDDPAMERLTNTNRNFIIKVLNTLSLDQKEWYIITLHELLICKGKTPEEIKVQYVSGITEDIGISEEQYFEIIKKESLIFQKYFRS